MHTYDIAKHSWFNPDGTLLDDDCYSGAFPLGFNIPEMVAVKDVGPLPPGLYTLGQMQPHHPVLGPNVIPLLPDAENVMYGRGDFFLHGKPEPPADIRSGSDGCICAQESTRLAVNASLDVRLKVI